MTGDGSVLFFIAQMAQKNCVLPEEANLTDCKSVSGRVSEMHTPSVPPV
jgi:hypothetical protein